MPNSSSARSARRAVVHPSSFGTTAMFSATVMWGKSPMFWMA